MSPTSLPTANASSEALPEQEGISRRPGLRKEWAGACLVIFLLSTLIFLPIFLRGFPNGIDADRHFSWMLQFSDALAEPGVLYPRWLGSANNQQGSPVTLYYPPLTFYVAAGFNLLFPGRPLVFTFSCWLGLCLSGVSMYLFARSFCPPLVALFAAACYLFAPYHLFDLFQGGSLAEYWAFVWLPLVFHGVYRVVKRQSTQAVLYLAVSYALLVLTHVPTTFLASLLLPIYILLLSRDGRTVGRVAVAFVLGVGLSAVFVLPLLLERDVVRTEAILKLDYEKFFLFTQTRRALKTDLFRHDLAPYISTTVDLKPSDFRFHIKTEQTAVGTPLLFALLTVLLWLNRRRLGERPGLRKMTVSVWVVTWLSLLMMSRLSGLIWSTIPKLTYLQLPCRWLVIASFGVCALLGVCLTVRAPVTRARAAPLFLLAIAVLFNVIVSVALILRAPYDPQAFNPLVLRREVPEYRPVWWDNQLHEEEALAPCSLVTGEATIEAVDATGSRQSYVVRAESEAVIKFRTLYFPGWAADIDGRRVPISPGDEGRIQLAVAPGEHNLTLRFEDTRPRTAGKILSALSLLVALASLLLAGRRRRSLTRAKAAPQNKAR